MDLTPGSEEQARVEQLLREAHLHQMRGHWATAEALCRKALDLSAEDPTALEMLADALFEKGSYSEALTGYRKVLELYPDRMALEDKVARVVLRQAEEEREKLALQLMLNSPQRAKERKQHAMAALWVSLICPGGGQFFLKQYWKAAFFFGLSILGLGIGGPDLLKFALGLVSRLPGRAPNDFFALLGFVGILAWVAGILDAAALAGKTQK